MSINYKHKTHKKNSATNKSLCGKDDVDFSDIYVNCKSCTRVFNRHLQRIEKENAFKRGMK